MVIYVVYWLAAANDTPIPPHPHHHPPPTPTPIPHHPHHHPHPPPWYLSVHSDNTLTLRQQGFVLHIEPFWWIAWLFNTFDSDVLLGAVSDDWYQTPELE